MASPNNTIFRKVLDQEESPIETSNQVLASRDGVRSPFDILKKWARHPVLRKYHCEGNTPYILFGNQILLLEYSLKPSKGSNPRAWFRVWEPFFPDNENTRNTFFRVEDGYCETNVTEKGFLQKMVREYIVEGEAKSYPKSHKPHLNNSRHFSSDSKYYSFKVDRELKKRSQIASEIFEITTISDINALDPIKKKAGSILKDMIDKNKVDRW